MVEELSKSQACQLYLDQEVDSVLAKLSKSESKDNKSKSEFIKEIVESIKKDLGVAFAPDAIRRRLDRRKVSIIKKSKSKNLTSEEKEVIKHANNKPDDKPGRKPRSDKKESYILRLPPELDKSIIEYQDRHELEQADAFVQLLERGLKKQDAAVASALQKELNYINKEVAEPMGLPTVEAIHIIVEYYLYKVKQETDLRTRNPIDGLLE